MIGTSTSKHIRPLFIMVDEVPVLLTTYSATKRRPWVVRATNRWKNKRARAARKMNRAS